MKILVSTLFFYKPELSESFLEAILPTLVRHVDAHPEDEIHFVVSDNTPPAQSFLAKVSARFAALTRDRLQLSFVANPYNLGFGPSHNAVFERHPSEAFVVLNNDLFIDAQQADWLDSLLAPIRSPEGRVALVGTLDSPSVLTEEAEGRYRKGDAPADYVEGSILAVRSAVGRELGLFSPELEVAYYEDSDLSLRYRQAGWDIAHVELRHEHRRGSSSSLVDPHALASLRLKNKALFLKRWKLYLERKTFQNRLFLDFCTGGWGDLIAALPTVTALLRDHPTATIELQTNHGSLVPLLSFPRVVVRTENFLRPEEARASGRFDRVFSLSEVDFSSPLYLGLQIANTAGVRFDMKALQSDPHLKAVADKPLPTTIPSKGGRLAVLHTQATRDQWEGRFPPAGVFRPLLEQLKAKGYFTILIGSDETPELTPLCDLDLTRKTTLLDLFPLFARAQVFVGMDSGPLHVAQLLGVPTFAIFGATLPSSRIYRFENSYAYSRSDLPCIACYPRKILSPRNYCLRRDEACVRALPADDLLTTFTRYLDNDPQLAYPHLDVDRAVWAEKLALHGSSALMHSPSLEETRLRHLASALFRRLWVAIQHKLGMRP